MILTCDPGAYTLPPDLDTRLAALWSDAHFAVDGSDLAFLNMCLAESRATRIVEIGTATGLSTGALAVMQAAHGIAGEVLSYDLRSVLWFDEARPVGDMVETVAGPEVAARVQLRTNVTALAVAEDNAPDSVGLSFVDASHQHPWPLIDTLLLLPQMQEGAPVVHHDLQLYHDRHNDVGVGPKILYDQLAPDARLVASDLGLGVAPVQTRSRAARDNIFALWRAQDVAAQGDALAEAFLVPWSIVQPLEEAQVAEIVARFSQHYPSRVVRCFEMGFVRDQAARARAVAQAMPPPRRSLAARVWGRLRG